MSFKSKTEKDFIPNPEHAAELVREIFTEDNEYKSNIYVGQHDKSTKKEHLYPTGYNINEIFVIVNYHDKQYIVQYDKYKQYVFFSETKEEQLFDREAYVLKAKYDEVKDAIILKDTNEKAEKAKIEADKNAKIEAEKTRIEEEEKTRIEEEENARIEEENARQPMQPLGKPSFHRNKQKQDDKPNTNILEMLAQANHTARLKQDENNLIIINSLDTENQNYIELLKSAENETDKKIIKVIIYFIWLIKRLNNNHEYYNILLSYYKDLCDYIKKTKIQENGQEVIKVNLDKANKILTTYAFIFGQIPDTFLVGTTEENMRIVNQKIDHIKETSNENIIFNGYKEKIDNFIVEGDLNEKMQELVSMENEMKQIYDNNYIGTQHQPNQRRDVDPARQITIMITNADSTIDIIKHNLLEKKFKKTQIDEKTNKLVIKLTEMRDVANSKKKDTNEKYETIKQIKEEFDVEAAKLMPNQPKQPKDPKPSASRHPKRGGGTRKHPKHKRAPRSHNSRRHRT